MQLCNAAYITAVAQIAAVQYWETPFTGEGDHGTYLSAKTLYLNASSSQTQGSALGGN